MEHIEILESLDAVRPLADSRRLMLLRLLMDAPATLTQLARAVQQSPAWVRHHIKVLESAGLVELMEIRKKGRVTEKYYRARANAFVARDLILPRTTRARVVFSGSHDLALEAAAGKLEKHLHLLGLTVGSLDGLLNLRQGLSKIAGTHLRDERGAYNLAYVRRLFPDREMEVVTLAQRTQGLMVRAGNPKSIRTIRDLSRPDVRFVNRNPGSGTRLWLDQELGRANIPGESIRGYRDHAATHTETAQRLEGGHADAALGLQAAAHAHGLGFVPLFEERYDLVFERQHEATLTPLLDYIQLGDFRDMLASLTGYNAAHSGEQVPV